MGLRDAIRRATSSGHEHTPTHPTHCGACGHPYTTADPMVTVRSRTGPPGTSRIHRSHTTDSSSGFYGAR